MRELKTPKTRYVLYAVFVLVVLIGFGLFIIFKDEINTDTLNNATRIFSLNGKEQAITDILFFDDGSKNQVTLMGNYLFTLSNERIACLDANANEIFSHSARMTVPVLQSCKTKTLAYERGKDLFVYDKTGLQLQLEKSVYSATINERGYFVVVTKESGYKSVATVYNTKNKPTFVFYSASAFITSAAVNPNGSQFVSLLSTQKGSGIETSIRIQNVNKQEPEAIVSVDNSLGLAVFYTTSNRICVLTETQLLFYNDNGELLSNWSFGDRYLLDFACTNEFFLLRTGFARTGLYSQVRVFSLDGKERATLDFKENIDCISAKYSEFSILTAGKILSYNSKGEEINIISDTPDIQRIIQENSKKILIIDSQSASFATY